MLNCMTVLPASEVTRENQHLLLSLLYEHLESIPQLENPQNMVYYRYTYCHSRMTIPGNIMSSLCRVLLRVCSTSNNAQGNE